MVVMERDDAIILTNLYPLLGNTAFEPTQMITIAPYHNTHILFNPYYRRYWNMDIPVQTIQEAQTNHLLDGIEDLVFVKLQWPNSHLTHLMLCKNLDKQVVTFPDATTQNDVTAMRISKDTFINDMLSPNGRAHACLHETP